MFALFLFGVWGVIVCLPLLEKLAKNEPGGVSIMPGIPVMPLMAWGLAALLDLVRPKLGYYVVGGLHIVLLAIAVIIAFKHVHQIKSRP
jgi:hypothetical protein